MQNVDFPGVSPSLWYTDELWADPTALQTFGYTGSSLPVSANEIFFPPERQLLFLTLSIDSLSEKAMAPHSRTLAWKIPWMEEPGGLQSMGSLRVGHDWATSLSLFTFMHWRRKWQPTLVFLPGESRGRGSLVSCCLWGRRVGHDRRDLAAA